MDWELELLYAGRTLLAAFLGALVGLERARLGCDVGARTFSTITFGTCVFSLTSLHASGSDPTRISAQVVIGLGLMGAGIIVMHRHRRISGLATAATLWACAGVGMASAYGMYLLAILTTLLVFATYPS